VQRGLLEAWIEVFNQAGVALDGMEPLPICLWRAAEPQLGEGVQVLLQLEEEQSWLLALEEGEPLGEWSLPAASNAEQLKQQLALWAKHYNPALTVVLGDEDPNKPLLPHLGQWLGCDQVAVASQEAPAALWGLVRGDQR